MVIITMMTIIIIMMSIMIMTMMEDNGDDSFDPHDDNYNGDAHIDNHVEAIMIMMIMIERIMMIMMNSLHLN